MRTVICGLLLDVDVDDDVLRAQAYASMPTSYIINYIYK